MRVRARACACVCACICVSLSRSLTLVRCMRGCMCLSVFMSLRALVRAMSWCHELPSDLPHALSIVLSLPFLLQWYRTTS